MKQIKINGYYVKVFPQDGIIYRPAQTSLERQRNTAREIIQAIIRHVDGVALAQMVEDREEVCGFCGRQWTEDGDEYNACCDADVAAQDSREALMDIEALEKYVASADAAMEVAEQEADRRRSLLAKAKAAALLQQAGAEDERR